MSMAREVLPAKSDRVDEEICPITKSIMRDPYIDFTGTSYEWSAIKKHLEKYGTVPGSSIPMGLEQLVPNKLLKAQIRANHPYMDFDRIDSSSDSDLDEADEHAMVLCFWRILFLAACVVCQWLW
jgi:hypothetical protein